MSSPISVSAALQALRNCATPITFQHKSALRNYEQKGACVTGLHSIQEGSVSVFTLNGNYPAIEATRRLYLAMKEKRGSSYPKGFNQLSKMAISKLKSARLRMKRSSEKGVYSEQAFCFLLMVVEGATGKAPAFYALARQHLEENRTINLVVTQTCLLNPSAAATALNVLRKFFDVLSLLQESGTVTATFCHTTTHPHFPTLIKSNPKNYTISHNRRRMSSELFRRQFKENSETDYYYGLEQSHNKRSPHSVNLARILVVIRPANKKPLSSHLMLISRSGQHVSSEEKSLRSNRLKQSNTIGNGSFVPASHTPHQNTFFQAMKSANTLRFEKMLKQVEEIYRDSQSAHMFQTGELVLVVSRLAAKSRECVDQILAGKTGSPCAPHPSNLCKNKMEKQGENGDDLLFLEGPLQEKALRPKSLALLKSHGRIMEIYPYFKATDRNTSKQTLIVKKFLELAGYFLNKDSNKKRYIQVFAPYELLASFCDGPLCQLLNPNLSYKDSSSRTPVDTSLSTFFDDCLKHYRYCRVTNPITGEITSIGTQLKQKSKEKFLQEFTPIDPFAASQKLIPSSRENPEKHGWLGKKERSSERKQAVYSLFNVPLFEKVSRAHTSVHSSDKEKKILKELEKT